MGGPASHVYHALEHATPSMAQAWAKRQQRLKRMVPVVPVAAPVVKIVEPPPAPKPEPAVPAVKPIWFSIIEAGPRRYYIQEIQLAVCEHFGITMLDLNSARRTRSLTVPRQIGFYLCKHMTSRSLPEIGRRFGDKDHTTVLHGVRKITSLLEADQTIIDHVNSIRMLLDDNQAAASCSSVEDQAAVAISQGGASPSIDLPGAQALDPPPRA